MSSRTELPAELEPPPRARRMRFHTAQLVAVPLMLLLPVLALFGVFGQRSDHAQARTAALRVEVTYTSRMRYKQSSTVEVAVQNTSSQTLDTVLVSFDPEYLQLFAVQSFIPSPREPFIVELTGIAPGATKQVRAGLEGEQYGTHHGYIKAFVPGIADTAVADVETLIFP